ncbi:glycoside hydrolase family 51 protein [Mycena galopus ATCC 62051]|nr:glycoside hydrolase family 51 protein [Mycena galopus ATCC 62051]
MFEDISVSGDGGLYGELLQNRAFQQVTPNTTAALSPWIPVGADASISVIADPSPLSSALPNSLALSIPAGTTGQLGFANGGYWGINFIAKTEYTASLYYRLPAALSADETPPTLTLALQAEDGTTLASHSRPLAENATGGWTHVSTVLVPTLTPASTANFFTVTIDGAGSAGLEINFALFSLFPPTFKGRVNGMRADIVQTLQELRPAFFRFPGGNNLEGGTTDTRWQWRNTVGPLVDRPGRLGDWGYINTDGLGLLEYLLLCEDLEMEPFMAVWAGYSLGGTSVTGDALQPFIEEAINQILFVIGDPEESEAAALRASLGHPTPFSLTYVEIGNEDFTGHAPETYQSRWNSIVTNLTATFPQLQFMATSRQTSTPSPVLTPTPLHWDIHVYQTPTWFSEDSFYYDTFVRNGTTYFEGEYAATSINASSLFGTPEEGRFLFPTLAGSVAEAAFMTGFERNADIVFAAAYAPLLGNVNNSQWTPNLIGFDANTVYKSTSYYVQQLFSLNKGDEYLPSTLPDSSTNATLFWSVTRWSSTGELIIKISNNAATAAELTFVLPFEKVLNVGTAQVLTGEGTASNTPDAPDTITPATTQIPTGATFNYTAPAVSVTVITLSTQ